VSVAIEQSNFVSIVSESVNFRERLEKALDVRNLLCYLLPNERRFVAASFQDLTGETDGSVKENGEAVGRSDLRVRAGRRVPFRPHRENLSAVGGPGFRVRTVAETPVDRPRGKLLGIADTIPSDRRAGDRDALRGTVVAVSPGEQGQPIRRKRDSPYLSGSGRINEQ